MLSDDILSSRDMSGLLVYSRKCLLVVTVARSDIEMRAYPRGSKTARDNWTLDTHTVLQLSTTTEVLLVS